MVRFEAKQRYSTYCKYLYSRYVRTSTFSIYIWHGNTTLNISFGSSIYSYNININTRYSSTGTSTSRLQYQYYQPRQESHDYSLTRSIFSYSSSCPTVSYALATFTTMDTKEQRFLTTASMSLFTKSPTISRHISSCLQRSKHETEPEASLFCQVCFSLQLYGKTTQRTRVGTLCLICKHTRKSRIERKPGRRAMLAQQKSILSLGQSDVNDAASSSQSLTVGNGLTKQPVEKNSKSRERQKLRSRGLTALLARQKDAAPKAEALDLSHFML